MNTLRNAANHHPLTIFFIAAYALSWWSIPFADGGLLPHGPFLAAIIVLALTKGKAGLGEFLRRITSWRGRWYWLLIGPGLVIAYLVLALGINLLLGASITNTSHLHSFAPTFLMLFLLGGMWEEPGWSGYALPMLQERFSNQPFGQLKASLLMGVLRAGWHIPLVISGAIPWYDVVFFAMAFQFIISWLFNRTHGNVLIVMLFHLTSNVVGGGFMVPLFSGSDHARYYQLFIAMAWLLAIPLAWSNKWSMGRHQHDA
jgi:uncharacterized protein